MANTVNFILSLQDKFSKKLGKAAGAASKFDSKIKKLTPSIGGLGKQIAGLGAVAAIGTLFVKTAKDVAAYETNIASLSAITGASGEQLKGFEDQIAKVADTTKGSSVEIAKAFELVGSAKPELLQSAEALGKVTQASIILSKASGETLETSVQSLTGTLNQFGLGANAATMVIDTLAAGAKEGAAAVPLITQSLDKFGTVAASLNLSVADSVGLIETLAEKNIKGAEAGTALRNVLIKMSTLDALPPTAIAQLEKFGVNASIVTSKTLPLTERLAELGKISGDSTALFKVFGAENLVAGQILLNNVDKVAKYTEAVSKGGVAQEQFDKNTNTLTNRLSELSNKWTNLFTSSSEVSGGLDMVKNAVVFLTDNLGTIVTVIGSLVAVFAVYKAATMAITIATQLWTGAQAALNIVMNLNPVSLIVIGIAALVAIVAAVIIKFDTWGAALSIMLGPLGLVISLVQSFRRNWDDISNAFKTEGIIEGLKKVGATILDAVLMPLEQLFSLMKDVPLIGDIAGKVSSKISAIRGDLGVNIASSEPVAAAAVSKVAKPIQDPFARGSIAVPAGATTGAAADVAGSGTTIKSAAPKTFNLTIGSLIEEVVFSNNTTTESNTELATRLKEVMLGVLNDVQTELA